MDYAAYLRLDRLLAAQEPRTDAPDEPLFIVAHQVSELWMKLLLKELGDAIDGLASDSLGFAFRALSRASRIFDQMIRMWDVLSTMTPADYLAFRDALGTSSGLQSIQYRLIEVALGARDSPMLDPARHAPESASRLRAALAQKSLGDEAVALLGRRGFSTATQAELEAAWADIYADPSTYWDLYELAEKLVDIENKLQIWRFTHLKTVERIIGRKIGTGGTSGVAYLEGALRRSLFPELLAVRSAL
jgi:tryptophan 2,3-dioxygenase